MLGIGGESVNVRFIDARLRLHPDGGDDDEYQEWDAKIGVVTHWKPTWQVIVRQVGFMDHFTVSMSRFSQSHLKYFVKRLLNGVPRAGGLR